MKKNIKILIVNFVKNDLFLLTNSLGFEMPTIGKTCGTIFFGNAYLFMERLMKDDDLKNELKIKKEKTGEFLQLLREPKNVGLVTHKIGESIYVLESSLVQLLIKSIEVFSE